MLVAFYGLCCQLWCCLQLVRVKFGTWVFGTWVDSLLHTQGNCWKDLYFATTVSTVCYGIVQMRALCTWVVKVWQAGGCKVANSKQK